MEKEKLIQCIREIGTNLSEIEIPEQYRTDLDVAMTIAEINGFFLSKLDLSILNKELVLKALKSNFMFERYVPQEFYDDKEIVLLIVSKNGHFLWKASDRLKDDTEVVMTAIKNDSDAIMFASARLKESDEIKELLADLKRQKKEKRAEHKKELEAKVEEFKDKPIWWQDEKIVNSEKLENKVTSELVEIAQKELGHALPNSYLELLNTQNGGRLIKRYYYLPEYRETIVFKIDGILGIAENNKAGIVANNYWYLDYINLENVVIFGHGDGHTYFLFDYNDLNDNEPKVVYYDEECDEKFILANTFKEFIDNLKIHEEIDLIYW